MEGSEGNPLRLGGTLGRENSSEMRSESSDAEDANMIIITGMSHLKELNGRDQIGDGVGPRNSFRKYREADRRHMNRFYVLSSDQDRGGR